MLALQLPATYIAGEGQGGSLTRTPPPGRICIPILVEGEWSHPSAPDGRLVLSPSLLSELVQNFKAGIMGAQIPMDVGHAVDENGKPLASQDSVGWVEDMWLEQREVYDPRVRRAVKKWVVWAQCRIAHPEVAERVKQGRLCFASPVLYLNYKAPMDGKTYSVIALVSLTNTPYQKELTFLPSAVALQEDWWRGEATGGTSFLHHLFRQIALQEEEEEEEEEPDERYRAVMDRWLRRSRGEEEEEQEEYFPSREGYLDSDASHPDIPLQCLACKRLREGSCPFKVEGDPEASIKVKIAAAGDGICPQFWPEDLRIEEPTHPPYLPAYLEEGMDWATIYLALLEGENDG